MGNRRHHAGVDIRAKYNQVAGAAADGTVIYAGWLGGYGNCVKISHGGEYVTVYGHLNRILVKKGEKVRRYRPIGKVGSTGLATGPHLHFEIRYRDEVQDPLDYLW